VITQQVAADADLSVCLPPLRTVLLRSIGAGGPDERA